MQTMIIVFGACAILCIVASVMSIKREPRRLLNGLLIIAAIVFLFYTLVAAFGRNGGAFGIFVVRILFLLYIVLFIMGLILIVNGFIVIKREGKSIPNILPFFFGAIAIASSISGYQEMILGLSGSMIEVKIMSILYNIALYVPMLIGAVLIYSIIYLHLPKDKDAKYIIVLGCGLRANGEVSPLLRARLDKAISWYKLGGSDGKFVVSGGQGSDEIIAEAEAMKRYLLTQGIPEEKILKEDKSVNTRENLLFSKKIIEADGGGSTLICTSNYHVLRAVIFARGLGVNAQGIGGHTAAYYLPVAFFREYIAMIFKYKALILVYLILATLKGLLL